MRRRERVHNSPNPMTECRKSGHLHRYGKFRKRPKLLGQSGELSPISKNTAGRRIPFKNEVMAGKEVYCETCGSNHPVVEHSLAF